MSAAHEPFAELVAAYALDALDGEELARFRVHLREGCLECRRALRDYQEALAQVGGAERATPPADARAALLARVAGPAAARRRVVGPAVGLALAAGLAALATGVVLRARYEPRLAQVASEAAALRTELATQQRTLVGLRQQLEAQEQTLTLVRAESAEQGRTLALLQDPTTDVVALAGLPPSPGAKARMLWNPRAGGFLVAADLPPAPEGKIYELWAIAAGKPVPAGLFAVDAQGRGTLRVATLPGVERVDVFAVTLEPAGGVPAPTGAMYLASKAA